MATTRRRPRFGSSTMQRPFACLGSAGSTTDRSAANSTSPAPLRGASFRSQIRAFARVRRVDREVRLAVHLLVGSHRAEAPVLRVGQARRDFEPRERHGGLLADGCALCSRNDDAGSSPDAQVPAAFAADRAQM